MNKLFFKTTFFILLICLVLPLPDSIAKSQYLVVVDPAHGGRDEGVKLSGKFYEKDVTLSIARLLKEDLDRTKNIKVLLTRSTDKEVSLSDRSKVAKRLDVALFISLHVNAGFGKNSSGFEMYFPGFKSPPEGESTSKEISKDMVETKYLNESVRFVHIVQKNMEKIFSRKDRGLRPAPILVLEGLSIPAIVLEIGFATNVKDRKELADEAMQKTIAGALVKSIKEFYDYSGSK